MAEIKSAPKVSLPSKQPSLPAANASLTEEEKEKLEEPVELSSSMLQACAYSADDSLLIAYFLNGDEETYGCTLAQYEGLLKAASPGQYMWQWFLGTDNLHKLLIKK
jgi:hypothetical protein